MNTDRVDRQLRWAPWTLGAGLALIAASRFTDGLFVITGFMLVWLGASAASVARWRVERGIWMLSALFMGIALAVYALIIFGEIRDHIRGRVLPHWTIAVDAILGTRLLWIQVRFLAAVTRLNRALSRP
jgi:hypothetical protein